MKIKRTSKAIKVTCKCGACIASTLIYGGIEIDADFTDIMADAILSGGKVEIVDTDETPITFSKCTCKQ